MLRLLVLTIVQCTLLTAGQVFLKVALTRMLPFGFYRAFWVSLLANWPFACCGLCYGGASLLWMYILKHFPLSVAYPLVSLSYVLGMVAAVLVFHEQVSLTRWIGLALIVAGVALIVK